MITTTMRRRKPMLRLNQRPTLRVLTVVNLLTFDCPHSGFVTIDTVENEVIEGKSNDMDEVASRQEEIFLYTLEIPLNSRKVFLHF